MDISGALRILVPLDGTPPSSQALPYAQALAVPQAEILLLQVMLEPQPERALSGKIVVSADDVRRRLANRSRAELEAEADRVRTDTPSIAVDVTFAVGHPAEQILETARVRQVDLVVMATNSRTIVGRLVIGSVSDRVVQIADLPVLVVRLTSAVENLAPANFRRMVLPLDGSDTSDLALPVAERLAAHIGLPIHLVTVAVQHRAGLADHLDQVGADLERSGVRASSEVLTGSAIHANEQASHPGDLVAMGSHHRSGVTAWLLRGVAEQLIHGGRVPVLQAPNVTSPAPANSPK